MDVFELAVQSFAAAAVSLCVLYVFYRAWILPTIKNYVDSVPSQVRTLIEPYVENQIERIEKSVRGTTARFARTVNTAKRILDNAGIDVDELDDPENATAAREELRGRYGADLAAKIVSELLTSITANKSRATAAVEPSNNDGWC